MKRKNKYLLSLIVILLLISCQKKEQKRQVTVIEYQKFEKTKALIKAKNEEALNAYAILINKADSALHYDAFSVVNKTGVPPSGNKHDYMSIGPYWWPNPDTPDGLPYIRKDGEINPETRDGYSDYSTWEAFHSTIKTLTKAYYYTDKTAYASKAVFFIKAWMVDGATKMNPHLNYGQSIPGAIDGRPFGVIEFGGIKKILACLELLDERHVLDVNIKGEVDLWLTEYVLWLQTSKIGLMEANTLNNHGTHYDSQLLALKVYLGEIDFVKEYLNTVTKNRIFSQIEPNGSQPKELARTKSFSYSTMNMHELLQLAFLGQKLGVDLWNAESADGRSIKKAYQYMLPYLTGEKQWKHQQIVSIDKSIHKLTRDLTLISEKMGDDTFLHALERIEKAKD